jgi:hypothetical protein
MRKVDFEFSIRAGSIDPGLTQSALTRMFTEWLREKENPFASTEDPFTCLVTDKLEVARTAAGKNLVILLIEYETRVPKNTIRVSRTNSSFIASVRRGLKKLKPEPVATV